jgi:hypothetical protein
VIIDVDGLSFVAPARHRDLVTGLRVEIQEVFGREGLVAWNSRLDGGGC